MRWWDDWIGLLDYLFLLTDKSLWILFEALSKQVRTSSKKHTPCVLPWCNDISRSVQVTEIVFKLEFIHSTQLNGGKWGGSVFKEIVWWRSRLPLLVTSEFKCNTWWTHITIVITFMHYKLRCIALQTQCFEVQENYVAAFCRIDFQ